MITKIKNLKNNWLNYAWIIIVSFFLLGILDFRFGLLGFFCMGAPIYHALKGEGKKHCAKYCPRGSFLGKIVGHLSLGIVFPQKFRTRTIKHVLLVLMVTLLTLSLSHAGMNIAAVGFVLFRFMLMSFIVGILMGILFKPRSWCQVCPMGHAASLITETQRKLGYDSK